MGIPHLPDYAVLDHPAVLRVLFHPRPETPSANYPTFAHDVMIPVASGVQIGARFHVVDTRAPNILFFHGNGEIVADYDDLGLVYNQRKINFLVVDYRGYGRSDGTPTVAAMMKDCHVIFDFVQQWLSANAHQGSIIVMGRSLGSASALELTRHHPDAMGGLIIESGFASAGPLLQLLGVDIESIGYKEGTVFRNIAKIARFTKPTLIIHAEFDHIIPFADGRLLHAACAARKKHLLKIPGANHNDILMRGLDQYLEAVTELIQYTRMS